MVTVLVLVGILGFAAYPLLSSIREVMLVKGAAEQTAAAVRLARQLAITNGTNHCIEFGPGGPPRTQYRIRQADTSPACIGTAVSGYDWHDLSDSGTVAATGTTFVFDPIGNRVLPAGPTNATFNVDSVPPSCLSVITVTLYGGVRVAGC
jgi:hypothetical protein